MTPCSEIRPKVGLMHVSPCRFPGPMTEPPVWVPTAATARRPATAVALPDDEPPGDRRSSFAAQALRVVGIVVP